MKDKELPEVTALELELRSGWLTIWFNQPDKRNAFTAGLVSDLCKVLDAVRDDRNIRGITLRGRGGVFCAGGDLKAFRSSLQGNNDRAEVIAVSAQFAGLFDLVNQMPQVVVVVIEGAAMAGGLGLACCADVVICQSDARFALTETAIGLSPAQIAPFVMQRLGHATARRLMLTAARFRGAEARSLGLADFVAEETAGLDEIEANIRSQVLGCAPGAIAATKKLILALPGLDRGEAIKMAADNFADRMLSDEAREGITAFFEKRKPHWARKDHKTG